MTTRSRHDGGGREFLFIRFCCDLASPDFKLHVLLFQNSGRRGQLHATRGKYGLRIPHAVRLQQRKSLEEFRA